MFSFWLSLFYDDDDDDDDTLLLILLVRWCLLSWVRCCATCDQCDGTLLVMHDALHGSLETVNQIKDLQREKAKIQVCVCVYVCDCAARLGVGVRVRMWH